MLALARVAGRRVSALPARLPETSLPAGHTRVAAAPGPLSEHESALLLERYGVPFAPRRRASTPEEAAAAARDLGCPVVVKVDGVAHKARAGGVVLGIGDPEEAAAVAARLGGPVLVARQVEQGAEALCGMMRDRDFGPVLVVGAGGVAVEELARVAAVVAPVDPETAACLVAEAGVADPDGVVASTLAALGRVALEHPEIESIDVNPLVVGPTGTVAVDALVVVG
jgi:acetyltransferase